MTRIAFVQPKAFHSWEALNIGYLAAYLKERIPHIAMEFWSGYFDDEEEIVEGCRNADFAAFSCTSPQLKQATSIIDELRKREGESGPKVIIGGVHASAQPQHTLKWADYAVVGEGEIALQSIIDGKSKPGIVHFPFVDNLDSLPFPDRHFIKEERNITVAYRDNNERIASIFSSRGCPYRCVFCSSCEVWGRKTRYRNPSNVLDEMSRLVSDWKIDFVKFSDDTFTVDKDRVVEFCSLKRDITNVEWGCNIRATTPKNILEDMQKAGCREVWIGVESGSPSILKDMKKGIKLDDVKRVFREAKEIGLLRRAYFLLGMPNESLDDIKMTEKIAQEIDADEYGFTILAPYPNNIGFTPDLLDSTDWSKVDEYCNDITKTKHLTNEQLKAEQKRLVKEFSDRLCFRQRGSE